MREILFRGKRTDNGEWETGSLVIVRGGLTDEKTYITDKMTGYNTPVIPETVGQFTGLTDKNGTKIFEGDIVRGTKRWDRIRGVVRFGAYHASGLGFYIEWKRGRFEFNVLNSDFILWINNGIKVIGNIHDNPELLEAEA